ncbi:MAG TPA: 2-octaprenyl-6-methoxyphenyl hydroxylase [Steroidobacteraceae bacterium]|nr:2-octaprenyl-6-methoxyphenyl hydroxylase [Steroidobacteraceae bacterium]
MREFDVVIVGGGMVGASLALALAGTERSVALIESIALATASQPSFDERTTALGNASRRIFEALGVWSPIVAQAAAIRRIHISDAGRFGFARLEAAEQAVEAFGYVVANRAIGAALWSALERSTTACFVPASPGHIEMGSDRALVTLSGAGAPSEPISARLLVAADGANSVVRAAAGIAASVEDYGQVAIVANVGADRPHDGTAYERFTDSGPLAVLPLHDGSYTVVWARASAERQRVLALSDGEFLAELQRHFGWRVGRLVRVGRRAAYGLQLTRADAPVGVRTVLIGNAAQALHPVAGQGFNLGLRDAAILAELLSAHCDGEQLLAQFAARREADRRGVIAFTDSLVKLFADRRMGVRALRDLGLLLFDLAPPAKSALARVSTGFGAGAPRLARGLTLG